MMPFLDGPIIPQLYEVTGEAELIAQVPPVYTHVTGYMAVKVIADNPDQASEVVSYLFNKDRDAVIMRGGDPLFQNLQITGVKRLREATPEEIEKAQRVD